MKLRLAGHVLLLAVLVATQASIAFDIFFVGKIAPLIADALHRPLPALAPVFVAQQAGQAVGALVGGAVADRWGRRRVLTFCLLMAGLATLVTPFSTSVLQLALVRGAVGTFLGMAAPGLLALVAANAPDRWRNLALGATLAANPLGNAAGSLVATRVAGPEAWGQGFILGGVFLVSVLVPLTFAPGGAAASMSRRLPVAALAAPPFRAATFNLGLCFLLSMSLISLFAAWQPSYFHQLAGVPVQHFAAVAALGGPGAIAGMLLTGAVANRVPRPVLAATIFGGHALVLILIGVTPFAAPAFAPAYLLSVLLQAAGQGLLNIIIVERFPDTLRATAFGAAAAIGRFGGIFAPWFGAAPLVSGMDMAVLFALLALIPAFVGLILLSLGGVSHPQPQAWWAAGRRTP